MPRSEPAPQPERDSGVPGSFVLYVEGPRDRSILRAWANRLMPQHTRELLAEAVILGGRRPERAIEHFRGRAEGSRGLCLLDRDGESPTHPDGAEGLEFFTWGRRHIESYLLVPAAIRRALDLSPSDHRLEAALAAALPPPGDGAAWRQLDAKRLLADRGPLARALGRPLPLARIARCTRAEELDEDVRRVFERLGEGLARVQSQRRFGHAPAAGRGRGAARRRPAPD